MTFFLEGAGQPELPGPLEREVPGWRDRFRLATDQTRIEIDSWNRRQREANALRDQILDQVPIEIGDLVTTSAGRRPPRRRSDLDFAFEEIERARAQDPDAFPDLPATDKEFQQLVSDTLRAQHQDATDALANAPEGAWTAEVLGSLWAGATDEATVATLPFGAAAGASLARVVGVEALVNVGAEALTLPRQFQVAEELGIEAPNVPLQLGSAAVIGGALGGVINGADRAVRYAAGNRSTNASRRPAEQTPAQFEQDIQNEQSVLEAGGAPVRTPDPQDWPAIRQGIFDGESGGDFDALFGFSNREGGPFSDVRVSEMTVDEAIQFSNPQGPYAQWVKARIGRVATPMGAYQIVGSTLKSVKRGMGLTGRERMTEALQDEMGKYILRTQGTGAWEGYRGPGVPRSSPDLNQVYTPYRTTRGFTRSGQVAVGDQLRVDVDYEVVDLGQLQQASGNLQPRDRNRINSDAWVNDTAARLDPAQLLPSPTADRGAPLIGPDNIIESGNGRVLAIERAYAQFRDRTDAYRAQIEEVTDQPIAEDIERPVLVARRRTELTDAQRQQLVVEAQDSGVARMTATERAQVGQRALSADMLSTLNSDRPLSGAENGRFVRDFANSFPRSERNAFFDANGRLSTDGVRQVSDSIFARAFDAPDILARHVETEPGELRSLLDALSSAAPEFAVLRAEIEAGQVRPEMDITPFVLDATRLIMAARDLANLEGLKVNRVLTEMLAEEDLLSGAVAPLTQALVRKFMPKGKQQSAAKISAFLKRYATEARKAGRTGDALDSPPGPIEVLQAIDKSAFGDLRDTGVARLVSQEIDEAQVQVDALPQGAFDAGASSPEADALADAELRAAADPDDPGNQVEFELEDGTKITGQDLLRELEQDEQLEAVLDACLTGRAA